MRLSKPSIITLLLTSGLTIALPVMFFDVARAEKPEFVVEMQTARTAEREARKEQRAVDQAEKKAEVAERKETRLAGNQLKKCEKRQDVIIRVMQKISERGTAQVAVFDKIADRTKEFYVEKGYTVAEYDNLVAEVEAAHQNAIAATTQTTDVVTNWSCSTEDPKAVISILRTAKEQEIDALNAYKTSIRNLIVAVKSAQSQSQDDTNETEVN